MKAPSQIITYVSAHDNQTLWDKLSETMPEAGEEERLRLNRMAAALYMTCQGTIFFLSGEEFARTKDGLEDSFNAPIALNRLDWEKAWENRELVEYYKGLIALRSQLPGLCDKSAKAATRIHHVVKEENAISFLVDNRPENGRTHWQTLKVVYNSSRTPRTVSLEGDGWNVLCDGMDSRLWEKEHPAQDGIRVAPQSVLILGKTEEESTWRKRAV